MDTISMFCIYDSPDDFPGEFVVREWFIGANNKTAPGHAFTAPTLDGARALVPRGRVKTPPFPEDDPKIVEVWL